MLLSSIALVSLLCHSGCSLAQQINLGYRDTSLLTVHLAPVVSSSTVLHSTSFYYGFSHFVTTVNGLVIVFAPSAGIPDDNSSVSISTAISSRTTPTQDRTALSSMQDRTVSSSMQDWTASSSIQDRTVSSSMQDWTASSSMQDRTASHLIPLEASFQTVPTSATCISGCSLRSDLLALGSFEGTTAAGGLDAGTQHGSRASEASTGSYIPSNNYFERFSQLIFESVPDSSAASELQTAAPVRFGTVQSEPSVRFETWTGSSARGWAGAGDSSSVYRVGTAGSSARGWAGAGDSSSVYRVGTAGSSARGWAGAGDSSSVYRVGTAWPVQSAGAASSSAATVLDVTVEPAAVPLPPETRVLLTQAVGYRVRARPTPSALPETDVISTPSVPSQHRLELVEHFHSVGVILPTTSGGSIIPTDHKSDALPLEKLFDSLASRQGSVAADASRDRVAGVPQQQLFGKRRWSIHHTPDNTFNHRIY